MTKSLAYCHKRQVIAHWLQDYSGEHDTITRHLIDAADLIKYMTANGCEIRTVNPHARGDR